MQNILAPVNIENPSSFSTIILNDAADPGSRVGSLFTRGSNPADSQGDSDPWGEVSGLSPAPVSFEYTDTSSVTIDTGSGGGTFNVQNTAVPTNIVGNAQTTIDVGSSNTVAGITGVLNIENPASFNTININDSGDSTSRTVVLSTLGSNAADAGGSSDIWGQITGLGAAAINYEYNDTTSITLRTGTGGNTINVRGTGVTTNIVAGGRDTANIGDAGSVQGINGTLNLEDPPSFVTLNINDSADTVARNFTLSTLTTNPSDSQANNDPWGQIVGLAPAHINYEYTDMSSLTIRTGGGGVTAHVNATGVPTAIVGNALASGPDDAIDVGNGTVADIAAPLSLENPSGFDGINVNDNSDSTARTVTLSTRGTNPGDSQGNSDTWGRIAGLAPAVIDYEYADAHRLGITLGVGGNTVNVQAIGVPTTLLGGAVPPIILPPLASRIIPPILLGGPDTINIGNAGSAQSITQSLTIENSWSHDTITIDDSADAAAHIAALGTAPPAGDSDPFGTVSGLSPGTITYEAADTASLTVNGGTGANIFTISATPTNSVGGSGGPAITLNSGTGNDTVYLTGGQGAGTTLTLNGQGGTDTLKVTGAAAADAFSLVAGQITHGTSTANYSDFQTLTLDPGTFTVGNDLGAINLNAIAGTTTVNFGASQNLASLTVNAASATLTPGGSKVLSATALSIVGGGRLDLRDNSLQVHYGGGPDPIAVIRSWITTGYAGGTFNGVGLNSGAADIRHGLGYADSADGVVSGLAANTVLVKYALYGDTNLDGTVNFADLLTLAQNYNKHPGTSMWDQGDTNYDGSVNFNDLLKLAQDYGLLA